MSARMAARMRVESASRPSACGSRFGDPAPKPTVSFRSAANVPKGRKALSHRKPTRLVIANSATASKSVLYEELQKVAPNGLSATPDDKRRIAEIVTDIEQSNPTIAPAHSTLMPGFWRMLYTDMEPAPSSGKLGPFIGDVFQDLRPENSLILNLLKVLAFRLGPEGKLILI
eukprot:1186885-Prorocentrum_minimum.AAC.4